MGEIFTYVFSWLHYSRCFSLSLSLSHLFGLGFKFLTNSSQQKLIFFYQFRICCIFFFLIKLSLHCLHHFAGREIFSICRVVISYCRCFQAREKNKLLKQFLKYLVMYTPRLCVLKALKNVK